MILVNNPDVVVTAGKQYAIFAAMTIVTPISALGVGHRVNRRIEQALMVLSFAGVIVIVCTVLATANPRASAVGRISLSRTTLTSEIRLRQREQRHRLQFDCHCLAYRSPPVVLRLRRIRHRLPCL